MTDQKNKGGRPKKYTAEFILTELAELQNMLQHDKKIVFVNQLFENKEYSRQRFYEWIDEYGKDSRFADIIKKIDEIIEARVVAGALNKDLQPIFSIFYMKNKFSWQDKQQVDVSSDGIEALLHRLHNKTPGSSGIPGGRND